MEKIKISILSYLVVLNLSCSSAVIAPNSNNGINSFESVKLGVVSTEVKRMVGEPSEIRESKDGNLWIYNNNDEYKSQRAAITFDGKTGLVDSVTIIPVINSANSKLEYLQNEKLPAIDYVAVPLDRCHRDYFPSVTYYVSMNKGFIIEYDRHFNSVHSYSLTSGEHASDLIQKIKNCKR